MSTVVHPKGHRHTRSTAIPPAAASPHHPQDPQNSHHLNVQEHSQSGQSPMDYSSQPTTPPRTPRRDTDQAPSQSKANSSAPETGARQKLRNKKPKNGVTSPAATGIQSTTVASSSKPISTPAAYAGPTFHASPAPSALPIPSFYSKSVPDSPGIKGTKPLKEPSSPGSPTPPPAQVSSHQLHREESPLDFFFRADRAEKARARSASSTQTAVPVSGPFQPPSESHRASQTPPASASQGRLRHASKLSSGGVFAMELDGNASPGIQYGPAFSTPYSERINAARTSQVSPASSDQLTQGASKTPTSEALKAYLFATSQQSSSSPPSTSQFGVNGLASHGTSSAHTPTVSGRSSALRQEVTPTRTPTKTPDHNVSYATSTTPSRIHGRHSNTNDFISTFTRKAASPSPASPHGAPSGNRSGDLKDMEESLRKMLKLDSAGGSGVSGLGNDDVPASVVPVPSYIGGRAPPLNGMHNGVMGS
jgi:hypothetical protein